jgi:hypothetical protein
MSKKQTRQAVTESTNFLSSHGRLCNHTFGDPCDVPIF